jgi:hypothetical protein
VKKVRYPHTTSILFLRISTKKRSNEYSTLCPANLSYCNVINFRLKMLKTNSIYGVNLSNHCTCFIDKNECEESPCLHNGTCINNEGSYKCDCTVGWMGKDCNTGTQEILLYTPSMWSRDAFSIFHLSIFKNFLLLQM